MKNLELVKHLKKDLFLPDLKAANLAEALEALVDPLVAAGRVKSKNLVLETLRQRESLGSTGIGRGVAVPHCRTTAVSDVHIVTALSKNGVDFNAPDKKIVHLFFLIVAPPMEGQNLYLPILGKVVEMVRDAKTRQALTDAADFAAFLKIVQGG